MEKSTETAVQRVRQIALLMCGNEENANKLTVQALAAVREKPSEQAVTAGTAKLLRLFTLQGDEPMDTEQVADAVLIPLLRLPESKRALCAMQICGFTDAELSDVLDCTLADAAKKRAEIQRMLAFAKGEETLNADALRAFADAGKLDAQSLAELTAQIAEMPVEQNEKPRKIEMRRSGAVQEIAWQNAEEEKTGSPLNQSQNRKKTVRLPVWLLVICIALPLTAAAVFAGLYLIGRDKPQTHSKTDTKPSSSGDSVSAEKIVSPYLNFSQVREKAAAYMGRGVDDVTFIKTKLDTETDPASYQIVFFDQAGAQYECLLDAKNGDLLDSVQSYTDMVVDTRKFLPLNEVRRLALETAGLSDAVFTKEKLDSEDDIYYYKIEFYDAVGKSYDVELVAETGALLKYTFKEQARIDDSRFISLADAKKNALVRAGDFREEQVTFTKEKLDGAVYLLSFTLEDGTQYTIELDAETGLANTVDVVRASADTTQFIGFSAAKELAMKKAGLPLTETVTYTKAKIDRENAAYVYELEFENGDYQYEVRLNTKTGEILKFRAWFQ